MIGLHSCSSTTMYMDGFHGSRLCDRAQVYHFAFLVYYYRATYMHVVIFTMWMVCSHHIGRYTYATSWCDVLCTTKLA